MKTKTNFKQVIAGVGVVLVIISGFLKFIDFSYEGVVSNTYNTFDIVGTYMVLVGGLVLIYGIGTKNKLVSIIAYVICFLGYGYTFYKVYSVIRSVSGIVDYRLYVGFYIYIVTALIFISTLFVDNNKQEESDIPNELKNVDRDSFIIGNMLLGFKEIPYNDLVLLKIENSMLSLSYKNGDNIDEKKILVDNVNAVTFVPDLSVSSAISDESVDTANMLLAYSVLGGPVKGMIGYQLLNFLTDDYEKVDFKTSYVVTIKYIDNGEEHEVKIVTGKAPKGFTEKVRVAAENK